MTRHTIISWLYYRCCRGVYPQHRRWNTRGINGPVGAGPGATRVRTLRIEKPGVYENILVDGEWAEEDLVRIQTDHVVLRNRTIRYGRRDAVEVYGRNVRI